MPSDTPRRCLPLAAITDFLDGYLARRWHVESVLGAFLDTTADKLLVTGALLALTSIGRVSIWAALVIMMREFLVMGLRGLVASTGGIVKPSTWGKIKATAQYAAIGLAFMRLPNPWGPLFLDEWVMWIAVIVTIASAWGYFAAFSKVVAEQPFHHRGVTTVVTGGTGVVGRALLEHLAGGAELRSGHWCGSAASPSRRESSRSPATFFSIPTLEQSLCRSRPRLSRCRASTRCVSPTPPRCTGSTSTGPATCSRRQQRPGSGGSSTRRRRQPSVRSRERSETRRPVHRGSFYSHYERSKYEAEQVALTEGGGVEVVVVNPSSVQGPGRATGTGKILLDLIAGRLSTVVDTRISIVDIDDCARGHILAASKGLPGQRYILNSFSMTIQEAVGLLGYGDRPAPPGEVSSGSDRPGRRNRDRGGVSIGRTGKRRCAGRWSAPSFTAMSTTAPGPPVSSASTTHRRPTPSPV